MGAAGARRQAFNAFVSRHRLAWDLAMGVLAVMYIMAGLFEDHPQGFLNSTTVIPVELAITALFALEFTARFYAANSRTSYLRAHWIDLLALLPAVRFLRFLRLARLVYLLNAARLLRLGVLVRVLAEADRVGNQIQWIAKRHGVHLVLLSALGLVLIGGSLVWEIEHTSNPSFDSLGNAVWWAFATMTTVGYGNGPVTVLGRVIGGAIMVIGIACFGLITATVTTFFIEHSRGPQVSTNELLTVLEEIKERLSRLEEKEVISHGSTALNRELALPSGQNGQRPGNARIGQSQADRSAREE